MRVSSILSVVAFAFVVAAAPVSNPEAGCGAFCIRDAAPEPISVPEPVIRRDPSADPQGCGLYCTRDADPEPIPEPEPEPIEERGCGLYCGRDAMPEAEPEPIAEPEPEPGCGAYCI